MTTTRHSRWAHWVAGALAFLVIGAYGLLTPPGLLTKMDWIGAAVCHRIPSHSFVLAGRPLPLCARCTGTFLGALTALLGQAMILRRRGANFPPPVIMAFLLGFILLMGVDGVNSYVDLVRGTPLFYQPRNELRLITGALNGLALGALLWPMVNFSLWRHPRPERTIRDGLDFGILFLMEAGVVALVLVEGSSLLYPLALASALGVLMMLTLPMTILVVILAGWENRYDQWREAKMPLLMGLALAFLLIGLMDLFRYAITGTITGFPGLEGTP
ncbi:MAG: DUF2085 domain-containing protein [Anaerolineae bacterium]|nr:DUF2085 domain-containing protein [Anaerolineae bacterium]MDW8067607.1 DUF2085 domain-containing protein [Anaerolineae bacterium]